MLIRFDQFSLLFIKLKEMQKCQFMKKQIKKK